MNNILLALGNIYLETNYLGVETAGKEILETGHEYSAPEYEIRLGGSAVNFITQAKKFGLNVGLIGKTGNDSISDTLFELLKKDGIKSDLIKRSNKVQTNVDSGLVFAHNSQNIQVVAGSANQSLCLQDIDLKSPLFNSVNGIYFGGSFKQEYLWPYYPQIFKTLSKKGVKLFIDPGRVPVDAPSDWIDILKLVLPYTETYFPNDKEVLTVTGESNLEKAISEVFSWGAKKVVVKMGPEGCMVLDNGNLIKIKGYKVKAISTVGAGDVFNSSFVFKLLQGLELAECAKFANAAAAFRVSKNYQPDLNEVEKFIQMNDN
jgi:ribokinase